MKAEPFLAPGLAWALVVLFSVLWIALGVAWGRRGKGDAVQELTEIYERSQDLWIQQWRDEMAEIPMLNLLVA